MGFSFVGLESVSCSMCSQTQTDSEQDKRSTGLPAGRSHEAYRSYTPAGLSRLAQSHAAYAQGARSYKPVSSVAASQPLQASAPDEPNADVTADKDAEEPLEAFVSEVKKLATAATEASHETLTRQAGELVDRDRAAEETETPERDRDHASALQSMSDSPISPRERLLASAGALDSQRQSLGMSPSVPSENLSQKFVFPAAPPMWKRLKLKE